MKTNPRILHCCDGMAAQLALFPKDRSNLYFPHTEQIARAFGGCGIKLSSWISLSMGWNENDKGED